MKKKRSGGTPLRSVQLQGDHFSLSSPMDDSAHSLLPVPTSKRERNDEGGVSLSTHLSLSHTFLHRRCRVAVS